MYGVPGKQSRTRCRENEEQHATGRHLCAVLHDHGCASVRSKCIPACAYHTVSISIYKLRF